MTATNHANAAIEPTTILHVGPIETFDASGGKPQIQFGFYEGDVAANLTIAPIAELVIGNRAVVIWSFEGCEPGQLSFSAQAESVGFATLSKLNPEVGGAIATVEISSSGAVGPAQLTFIPR